jgi:hypothetical protein
MIYGYNTALVQVGKIVDAFRLVNHGQLSYAQVISSAMEGALKPIYAFFMVTLA